jgi:hypothetical protein
VSTDLIVLHGDRVELRPGILSDRRVRKLARRVGTSGFGAWIRLLLAIAPRIRDGRLRGLAGEELEELSGWNGPPMIFLQALQSTGLLIPSNDGWVLCLCPSEDGDPSADGSKVDPHAGDHVGPVVIARPDLQLVSELHAAWTAFAIRKDLGHGRRLSPRVAEEAVRRLRSAWWPWREALIRLDQVLPDAELVNAGKWGSHYLQRYSGWRPDFPWFVQAGTVFQILAGAFDKGFPDGDRMIPIRQEEQRSLDADREE